jgi:hypothetical protein
LNLQAKVVGKVGYGVSFSGYDEYVPMVDKVVDAEWKKQASIQRPSVSKGQQVYSSVLSIQRPSVSKGLMFICH